MVDLVQNLRKNHGVQANFKKHNEEIGAAGGRLDDFVSDKRLTAGLFWKFNGCHLNDEVLALRRRKDAKLTQKDMEAIGKAADTHNKRLKMYQALVDKGDVDKETVQVLKLWLQVRVKAKIDGVKIPMDKPSLLELKAKYALRNPLTLREYLIDAKPKDEALVMSYLTRLHQPTDGEATVMQGLDVTVMEGLDEPADEATVREVLNEDFAQLQSDVI